MSLADDPAKIEEGEIGAGRAFGIGIKQVVSADIILVYGLLYQAHPENAGVKGAVSRSGRCDRGDMMNTEELRNHWSACLQFILISS